MANATPQAARAGFEIFRLKGGGISKDDVNASLDAAGYGPISDRMYTHYKHLARDGFERYISINRFDVARASQAYENAASKARYHYQSAALGVHVLFAKSSRLFEAFGEVESAGDVGATIVFSTDEIVEGLRALKPTLGDMTSIRFLETGRTISARIVDRDLHEAARAVIEVEYSALNSLSEIGAWQSLPTSPVSFTLTGEDESQTADIFGQRYYYFLESLEGARSIANQLTASARSDLYVAPPILKSLRVASPAMVILELAAELKSVVPWALASQVLVLAGTIPERRKTWHEGTAITKSNAAADLDLELKQLGLDQKRLAAEEKEIVDSFRNELIARFRAEFPEGQLTPGELEKSVEELIIQPLRQLGAAGIDKIEVEDVPPTEA